MENSHLLNNADIKSQIFSNESRSKYISKTVDKDYEDFLRTLGNFSTIEDAAYNNIIIEQINKMQKEERTESIEIPILANGLWLANSMKDDLEKDMKNMKSQGSRIHRELSQ